jgi:DNA-binding CsgD family transcriptional regulator
MPNFLNASELLNLILKTQSHLYEKDAHNLPLIKDNYINEFSHNENSIKVVFDHEQFKILHISDNIERFLGYKAKEFYESSMLFVLKLATLDHFNFIHVWLNWAVSMHTLLGHLYHTKQIICGIKMTHKNGRTLRLLLRYSALEMTENGAVKIAAISIDDITHLTKGDFYWGRLEQQNEENITVNHFVSTDNKNHSNDIISEREKDVLRLLAEGKESKDIGKELFISSHTIDNHRRNMINRVGVRDTTGLIQICKMVGII